MILILSLEIRNLKKYNKIDNSNKTTLIVIIIKTKSILKVVMIIKLIPLCRHQPQKKLLSYLETV